MSARGDKELCAAISEVLYKPNFAYIPNVKIDFLFQITVAAILGINTRQLTKSNKLLKHFVVE